ncbi:MAG: hypothetical protein CSA34_05750 [Desulfobulbus propionicus]|nr:MAG: hypothetical protein CSA34_05750 [Desulfobulbus propionicus]
MPNFFASFEVAEERKCPLYSRKEIFVLTDQAVEFPLGRATCLILARELTGLLFALLPEAGQGFPNQKGKLFSCGGCTGLMKFCLTDKPISAVKTPLEKGDDSVMYGRLEAISPAELLQVFHMHQKTGRLILETENGAARITFREGGLIAARFNDLDNQEAIFALLGGRKGSFRFIPGLPEPLLKAREIGDFMMILMQGLKRLDESL